MDRGGVAYCYHMQSDRHEVCGDRKTIARQNGKADCGPHELDQARQAKAEETINSILVTGGTGYFGRAFARKAIDEGCGRVCILSRDEWKQHQMRQEFKNDPRLRWFVGDVRDRDRLRRAMDGVDAVVHAAALKRIEVGAYNPGEMVKTNVLGTINVIEAATDAGVKKVLMLSTDKACQPCSAYGHSKALAESVVLAANNSRGDHGPLFAVTRYGNVAGSTGSVIPIWRAFISGGATVVPVSDPEVTRFWMTKQQAVDLVWQTLSGMKGGELAIPALPAYRLGDLAEAMGVGMEVTGLPDYEKRHESMRDGETSAMARRMSVAEIREALADV